MEYTNRERTSWFDAESMIEGAVEQANDPGAVLTVQGAPAAAAAVFDALAGFGGAGAQRYYETQFEVIAKPGDFAGTQIAPGDLLIGRAYGDGEVAWALTVGLDGLTGAEPQGSEPSDGPASRHRQENCRITIGGRLPHNVMLVRPRTSVSERLSLGSVAEAEWTPYMEAPLLDISDEAMADAAEDEPAGEDEVAASTELWGEAAPWLDESEYLRTDDDLREDYRDPPKQFKVANTFSIPFRWICKVSVLRNGKYHHGGSGVLISDRHVLTAAHVVYDVYQNRAQYDLEVTPAADGNDDLGTYSSSAKPLIPALYEPEKIDYDYALITLDSAIARKTFNEIGKDKLRFWGSPDSGAGTVLVRVDPKNLLTQTAYTAGYPKNKGLRSMWCFSGLLVSVQEKNRTMSFTGSATEGQSGSPVWTQSGGQYSLVGILVARGDVNLVVRVTREFVRQIREWMTPKRKPAESEDASELWERESADDRLPPGLVHEVLPYQSESRDEAEDLGPGRLSLLRHIHAPKTPDPANPGTFKTGSPAVLAAADLNPGFIDASDNLITDMSATGLQTCLKGLISGSFGDLLGASRQTSPAANDHVRVAIADLTGAKLTVPEFAGWGSTVAIYGASVPKILALYGACQLRSDLREIAGRTSPKDGVDLEKIAIAEWKAKGLSSLLPDLVWLFEIRKWTSGATLDFTADVRSAFADIMHNCPAGTLIAKVGLPYIGSVTWQSGLFHPTRGGLWLKAAYCAKGNWASPVTASYSANATALSAAMYFTLLAQGRLTDNGSSGEISTALKGGCITSLFPSLPVVASKCGLWSGYVHDCAWIEDSDVRYVMVVMSQLATRKHSGLYTQLCTELDRLVRNNNKAPRPKCS